jgi:hypothetical protein
MALSGSALNGSLGSLGVTVSSVIAVALTGTAAGSAIHGPTMSQAAALAGQEIDILNQAIVGGLQLNTIPLHVLMGLIDTDLALGLGGLQAGTNTGIMDRTLPIAEEDWICIIDEDDWTVVIR